MAAYATLAEFKSYAGISATDVAQDALLTALLDRATEMCRSFTGREFAPAEESRTFGFDDDRVELDGDTLILWSENIASLTSMTLEDGTVVLATGVALLPRGNVPHYKVRLLEPMAWSGDTVQITGEFGFSVTPPDDIVHSVIRLAHFLFKQKDNASGDTDRPIVSPEGLLLMPGNLPADVQVIWQKYRRIL